MLLAWLSDGIAITIALRKTNFKIRCFQNVLLKLRWCTYIRIRLVNWQILTMARGINGSTNTYIITNSKRGESSALISCFRSLYLRNAVRKLEMIQKIYLLKYILHLRFFPESLKQHGGRGGWAVRTSDFKYAEYERIRRQTFRGKIGTGNENKEEITVVRKGRL